MLGKVLEISKPPGPLDGVHHSDPRELNSMGEVVGHLPILNILNMLVVVVDNTRDVVDVTRVVEGQHHINQVVVQLNIKHMSTTAVVVNGKEECHNTGVAVVDVEFLPVHQEQFPSCTKPHKSSTKLPGLHRHHQELARPRCLLRPALKKSNSSFKNLSSRVKAPLARPFNQHHHRANQ
ncbi:hypothetical protein E2562_024815 [Oryza meyeriana var. granulata]|uniref:Uncharacterized protein n=1 Tax=Oryza meyeriana var. granulata TaxID=110450 RepID=A0A6G1FBL0_9ORYZ|nr:hypothetical protein E2562_024815 [Oryza meyeriana var. granulata]